VIISCAKKSNIEYINDEGHLVREEFYKENKLKSRIVYINNDSSEYLQTTYYEDGSLKDSTHFINGKTSGFRTFYDQRADLLHLEHYEEGVLDGIHKAAYSNGVSSFEGFRKNGKMVGAWHFHYPDGNPITYEFYDSIGELKYFRKYGENGKQVSKKGVGIIYFPVTGGTIAAGSTLSLQILVAVPSLCKSHLEIKVQEPGDTWVTHFNQEVLSERIIFPFTFKNTGTYNFTFELNIFTAEDVKPESYLSETSFFIH